MLLCIKNLRESFAPLIRIASVVIFFLAVIDMLVPVISFYNEVAERIGAAKYGKLVLKALGISYLTYISSGICRDCGEGSIADWIETVAKIELLLLSLPLMRELLYLAEELLSW